MTEKKPSPSREALKLRARAKTRNPNSYGQKAGNTTASA